MLNEFCVKSYKYFSFYSLAIEKKMFRLIPSSAISYILKKVSILLFNDRIAVLRKEFNYHKFNL